MHIRIIVWDTSSLWVHLVGSYTAQECQEGVGNEPYKSIDTLRRTHHVKMHSRHGMASLMSSQVTGGRSRVSFSETADVAPFASRDISSRMLLSRRG